MAIVQISKIQVRRGQEKTTGMPQLSPGEFGWAEDTEHLYIGKRIAEGASTDENSRILTDRDLNNIFGLLGNVGGANTATLYQYKFNDPAVNSISTVRSVQNKLDDFVNVLDFVPGGIVSSLDSIHLQTAINTIFANGQADERKVLRLPAGTYSIGATITLPPYTTLVGEGPDVTVLVSATQLPMFETVDSNSQAFPMPGITANTQPKNIHIEGMTLRYQNDVNFTSAPLLSLDNVKGASIKDVTFGDISSSMVISTGTAVRIRGAGVDDLSISLSADIIIDDCRFLYMGTGIHQDTGTTKKFTIQNSSFLGLGNRGIEMWGAPPGIDGPKYGTIHNNKFDYITNEAIYIGTPTTTSTSYVVTSNNSFGQNIAQTTNGTAVVVFNDTGNVSSNDYFKIYEYYNSNFLTYYNPLVSGNCRVDIGYNYNKTIEPNTNYTESLKIPLTGNQQMAVITYELSNASMSRAGTLTMNTSPNPDGTWYSSVSDYYNYSENDVNSSLNLTFSTDFTYATTTNFVSLTCLNNKDPSSAAASTSTTFEYQLTLIV